MNCLGRVEFLWARLIMGERGVIKAGEGEMRLGVVEDEEESTNEVRLQEVDDEGGLEEDKIVVGLELSQKNGRQIDG